MPLISVILPYYKKINYIKSAIQSVINQTYKNFELIVIYDDEQKKDLIQIKKIIKNKKKIKLIINKKNMGAGMSRNIGIKKSTGKYIAFIDADDLWFKNKLKKQVYFITKNKYQFIFSNYIKKKNNFKKEVICKEHFLNYKKLLKSCDIGLSTAMIESKVLKRHHFPSTKTKEDFILWLKITKQKINAYNTKQTLVVWNKVENSLSSNIVQKVIDGFLVYYKYQNFNLIKSFYYLFILSINSLKK